MLMPHVEEHEPDSLEAPVDALVARVFAELSQAAYAMSLYEGEIEPNDSLDEPPGALLVARFAGIAVAALSAAARIHPDTGEDPPLRAKEALIFGLDAEAAEWIAKRTDWENIEPGYWLHAVTALLFGAGNGVCALHDLRLRSGRLDGEHGRKYWQLGDGAAPETAIGDSLYQAAQFAAIAAEWFEEQ